MVRVGANDALLIGRALDAGAAGVIVPLVNTAEEAARAVRSCRYPPVGERSFGPNRATLVMGSLDPRVIEDVACIVMVETTQGLANVDAIAATPGIDAILVDPSDLALGLGLDYDDRTEPHRHAVQRILDACTANGVVAGIVLGAGDDAGDHAALGFRFMSVATDIGLMLSGWPGSSRSRVAAENVPPGARARCGPSSRNRTVSTPARSGAAVRGR